MAIATVGTIGAKPRGVDRQQQDGFCASVNARDSLIQPGTEFIGRRCGPLDGETRVAALVVDRPRVRGADAKIGPPAYRASLVARSRSVGSPRSLCPFGQLDTIRAIEDDSLRGPFGATVNESCLERGHLELAVIGVPGR